MTATINVSWAQPDERNIGRTDPCWYVYQSTSDLVCTVSNGERSVDVYADGEMRIHVLDENKEIIGYIRYCDEFSDFGIINDEDYNTIVCDPEAKHAFGGITMSFDVIDSPWFDLYDNQGNHLDWVDFDLTDSINKAASLLGDATPTTTE